MKNTNESGQVGIALLAWGIIVLLCITVGGLLFEYSFEYWASYFKGHAVDIPFWLAMIGGLVLNGINLPIALITLLCSFVM